MARIDKAPVAFERWLFRWAFVPLLVVGVLWAFGANLYASQECRTTCRANTQTGATDSVYTASRRGVSSRCECRVPTAGKAP